MNEVAKIIMQGTPIVNAELEAELDKLHAKFFRPKTGLGLRGLVIPVESKKQRKNYAKGVHKFHALMAEVNECMPPPKEHVPTRKFNFDQQK